jgi:hypothetical protein
VDTLADQGRVVLTSGNVCEQLRAERDNAVRTLQDVEAASAYVVELVSDAGGTVTRKSSSAARPAR